MTDNQKIWRDLILGKNLGIPKKDILYGLPIRWWFHYEVTASHNGNLWDFKKWRDYLLSWEKTGLELFISNFFREIPSDKTFLPRTQELLKSHNALTINGFMEFYFERLLEYKILLEKEKIT